MSDYQRGERIPLDVSTPIHGDEQPAKGIYHLTLIGVVCYFMFRLFAPDQQIDPEHQSYEPHGAVEIVQVAETPAPQVRSPFFYKIKRSRDEATCLAQVMYSETNLLQDMVKVGWSVRNRVEAKYRGETYCEVAFAPLQYSGLTHEKDPNYHINNVMPQAWQTWLNAPENDYRRKGAARYAYALDLANAIIDVQSILNPVPGALWFWSPIAKKGMPNWAVGIPATYVQRQPGSKELRFAFYTRVVGERGPGLAEIMQVGS